MDGSLARDPHRQQLVGRSNSAHSASTSALWYPLSATTASTPTPTSARARFACVRRTLSIRVAVAPVSAE